MIELKPEDLIISVYKQAGQGGMHVALPETGVRVYHKPSGLDISCDKHRSQHRNRNECIVIIQDLLTPLEEGDVVYSFGKEALIISKGFNVCTVEFADGYKQTEYLDHVAHTKEGYIYITTERKQAMVIDYQKDIDRLDLEIKELNNV